MKLSYNDNGQEFATDSNGVTRPTGRRFVVPTQRGATKPLNLGIKKFKREQKALGKKAAKMYKSELWRKTDEAIIERRKNRKSGTPRQA